MTDYKHIGKQTAKRVFLLWLPLIILLLFLLFRLIVAFFFRTRRARSIVVTADDGDIQISQDAIAAAVGCLLDGFPELVLDTLKIYRNGGHRYFLLLHCRFQSAERTFPDVVAQVKEKVFHGLEKQFGICDLRKIRIVLTGWGPEAGTAAEKPDDAPEKADAPEIAPTSGQGEF